MMEPTHLSRAPIVEAVIDFRATASADFDVNILGALGHQIGSAYGAGQEINLLEVGWLQEPGRQPQSRRIDHGCIGSRYASLDGKHVAQFRKDGFTFSRFAPYTRWADLFGEASRLYALFVEAIRPSEITRIAVRYINRLSLPEDAVKDFSPFLTAPPPFPPGLGAYLTGFLTQIQIQEPDTSIAGTIIQTIQQGAAEPGEVAVILDLDIYEAAVRPPDPPTLLPRFETLRKIKNKYFFASITEKTLELFI